MIGPVLFWKHAESVAGQARGALPTDRGWPRLGEAGRGWARLGEAGGRPALDPALEGVLEAE